MSDPKDWRLSASEIENIAATVTGTIKLAAHPALTAAAVKYLLS